MVHLARIMYSNKKFAVISIHKSSIAMPGFKNKSELSFLTHDIFRFALPERDNEQHQYHRGKTACEEPDGAPVVGLCAVCQRGGISIHHLAAQPRSQQHTDAVGDQR